MGACGMWHVACVELDIAMGMELLVYRREGCPKFLLWCPCL